MSTELRQLCTKYESEIKSLQSALEEERERVSDLEGKLIQRETELEAE